MITRLLDIHNIFNVSGASFADVSVEPGRTELWSACLWSLIQPGKHKHFLNCILHLAFDIIHSIEASTHGNFSKFSTTNEARGRQSHVR